jgi:Zn-dependent protease with chaperone function
MVRRATKKQKVDLAEIEKSNAAVLEKHPFLRRMQAEMQQRLSERGEDAELKFVEYALYDCGKKYPFPQMTATFKKNPQNGKDMILIGIQDEFVDLFYKSEIEDVAWHEAAHSCIWRTPRDLIYEKNGVMATAAIIPMAVISLLNSVPWGVVPPDFSMPELALVPLGCFLMNGSFQAGLYLSLSRSHEFSADRLAVGFGADPEALAEIPKTLLETMPDIPINRHGDPRGTDVFQYMITHPSIRRRSNRLMAIMRKKENEPSPA